MPSQFSVSDNVQDFMKSFLEPSETKVEEVPAQVSSPVQQLFEDKSTDKPLEDDKSKEGSVEEGGEKPNVQDVFDKAEKEKVGEEDKVLIKDVGRFANLLKERQILEEYEDGTLPEKEEELVDALFQTAEIRANKKVEEFWKAKIEALPEQIVRIHEYAAQGATTAQELNYYINAVSQQEAIGSLDPNKPEDQEQIVLLQLINTGITEQQARDEVADLKERNKLEARASQYFPTLKKSYDENVRQIKLDKDRKEEDLKRYIQTNATNVAYFLEKDTEYLPFKFAANDKIYKQTIAQLASEPVEISPEGYPIFGWQKQIEALQYGTEADYKKYMKVMAFLANPDKYDDNVSKKGSNTATTTSFKKIKDTTGKSVNNTSAEPTQVVPPRQQANSKSWSTV